MTFEGGMAVGGLCGAAYESTGNAPSLVAWALILFPYAAGWNSCFELSGRNHTAEHSILRVLTAFSTPFDSVFAGGDKTQAWGDLLCALRDLTLSTR